MSYTKTISEFSSSRKIKYGDGSRSNNSEYRTPENSRAPLRIEESLSPHQSYYGKDSNNNEVYTIEFNIGQFRFDELEIKTDKKKLLVLGKSKTNESGDELSRDFKREFKLPADCDENSIKAELEEKSRLLKLVGQVIKVEKQSAEYQQSAFGSNSSEKFQSSSYQSRQSESTPNIGDVKEVKSTNTLEYQIYLGNELKDGQVIFEVPNKNTLNIRVTKSNEDSNGDRNLELKREIRLPSGARLNNIDHGVDSRTKNLIIKVPLV